ncbi:RelA/SpoT domain-containing protein [Robertmurraya beringensis]|uniref:RelA/SpoT domain-containing protein n=1 Tax=Robertmurraya beringensis TaxID=641660 RepID=A0ABV6KSJ8_9BACI
MEITKEQFFEKYNINKSDFDEAEISWESLREIHKEYSVYRESLTPTAEYISNMLRTHPEAHTVRTRVKDPEHLIDKIIRKIIRERKTNAGYVIDIDNYKTEITDLIGIRVLHLYKDQAASLDKFIRELWELVEKCTIYYREGDYSKEEEHEDNELFNFKVHPAGYRSWHYLISTKATKHLHVAEIQVRTIFEEGWSEIDHQLRYPNDTNNVQLTKQLLVLNRIAGSADEMATSIRELKLNTGKLEAENQKKQNAIDELKTQIETLLNNYKVEKADKEKLQSKVQELESSITVTFPSRQQQEFMMIGGKISNGIDLNLFASPGPLLTDQNKIGIFDTRKYLEGYTHPDLLKKDE